MSEERKTQKLRRETLRPQSMCAALKIERGLNFAVECSGVNYYRCFDCSIKCCRIYETAQIIDSLLDEEFRYV